MRSLETRESSDYIMYKDLNDNELLYFVRDNNSDGLNYLYEKYRPIVLSIAKKQYGLLNNSIYDIEDLIQSGYVGLQKAIDNFNHDKSVLFYTFAVFCINREISRSVFYSNNKYYRTSAYNNPLLDDISIGLFDVEDSMSSRWLDQKIYNFYLELDCDCSSVFVLRLSGFSYKEIAILLDLKLKRVDYIIQKCKNKLKKSLSI